MHAYTPCTAVATGSHAHIMRHRMWARSPGTCPARASPGTACPSRPAPSCGPGQALQFARESVLRNGRAVRRRAVRQTEDRPGVHEKEAPILVCFAPSPAVCAHIRRFGITGRDLRRRASVPRTHNPRALTSPPYADGGGAACPLGSSPAALLAGPGSTVCDQRQGLQRRWHCLRGSRRERHRGELSARWRRCAACAGRHTRVHVIRRLQARSLPDVLAGLSAVYCYHNHPRRRLPASPACQPPVHRRTLLCPPGLHPPTPPTDPSLPLAPQACGIRSNLGRWETYYVSINERQYQRNHCGRCIRVKGGRQWVRTCATGSAAAAQRGPTTVKACRQRVGQAASSAGTGQHWRVGISAKRSEHNRSPRRTPHVARCCTPLLRCSHRAASTRRCPLPPPALSAPPGRRPRQRGGDDR